MPKLTIGMLTHDDYEGLWPTIQSLRLHHREAMPEVEFLVLDNSPFSKHGEPLRKLMRHVGDQGRYLSLSGVTGTALRDLIFRFAQTPYVLCLDSHVLLEPGSVRRLIDYMDTHPEGNLLQGPMFYDNLSWITHMAQVWRSGMQGIWATAWECPCGWHFQTSERGDRLVCQTLTLPHQDLSECPQCARNMPSVSWAGHEKHLEAAGFRNAAEGEPFEIPAHGLGLFACRKDAWLGFNPEFQRFGGEECYIHEKFRQAGRTTLCLPWLRWLHRFDRVHGVTYPIDWESRVVNYLIGHRELRIDSTPVLTHFRQLLGDEFADQFMQKHPEFDYERP